MSKILVLFTLSFSLSAQELSQDDLLNKYKSLKNSSLEEYSSQMSELGGLTAEYIKNKEQECSGEFSSVVLDEAGNKKRVRKKLSKKEKSLCLYLLIDFRIKITKISFDIRANHMKLMHQVQLDELGELQQQQIKDLEILAKKYR